MNRYKVVLLVSLLLSLTLLSCNYLSNNKSYNEGVIDYTITYDDSIAPNYAPSLRPQKMVVKYKDKNMLNRIEAFSGAVFFTFIQNYEEQQNITLIKLLNKKLYYQEPMELGEYPSAYSEMPKLTFEYLNDTEKFLGYECNKVIATFADSTNQKFEILYTKEIAVENPNKNTPFEPIDGVMLKFRVKLYELDMNIEAISVTNGKVSMEDFVIPAEYELVNKETIYDVIYLLK